jgi:hypothetical protein
MNKAVVVFMGGRGTGNRYAQLKEEGLLKGGYGRSTGRPHYMDGRTRGCPAALNLDNRNGRQSLRTRRVARHVNHRSIRSLSAGI